MEKSKIPFYSIKSQDSILEDSYNLVNFMKKNNIETLYELLSRSVDDPQWYWTSVNDDLNIKWKKPFKKVVDVSRGMPWCEWFVSGKCNIIDNIIQKNVEKHPLKTAFIFIDDNANKQEISFEELELQVNVFAIALDTLGVKKGDRVGIYMPMRIESFVALYACSKLGAVYVPIFSGFGKKALEQRLIDSNSTYLITSNSFRRRGKTIYLKEHWCDVFTSAFIKKIVVLENATSDKQDKTCSSSKCDNILSFKKIFDEASEQYDGNKKPDSEEMDANDPLFILYTSGTTGKPKGTIQTHGGFSVFAAHQSSYLIDLKPSDILFWYADMGWITGQTWIVHGSPIIGSTAVIFEDVLDHPYSDSWARSINELNVTIFGAAPTAIRQIIKRNIDLSSFRFDSLRMLVSTGERLNMDAWNWYYNNIGKNNCPIINLSGGTEIGGAILSMLPFLENVPTSVGVPVPGLDVDILNDSGESARDGNLVIKNSWPAMTRGLLNDKKKYIQTYWSKFPDVWYHGDRVQIDEKKMWYIVGRTDDVIKISGHRIDPGEIEEILTEYPAVVEAAVVGIPDYITGESLNAFCVLKKTDSLHPDLIIRRDLDKLLEQRVGRFVLPRSYFFVNELPKNRSGKILRRLIRNKLLGHTVSKDDLFIVENPDSLDSFDNAIEV